MLKLLYFSRRLFGLAVNLFVQLWQFFFPSIDSLLFPGYKENDVRTHSLSHSHTYDEDKDSTAHGFDSVGEHG